MDAKPVVLCIQPPPPNLICGDSHQCIELGAHPALLGLEVRDKEPQTYKIAGSEKRQIQLFSPLAFSFNEVNLGQFSNLAIDRGEAVLLQLLSKVLSAQQRTESSLATSMVRRNYPEAHHYDEAQEGYSQGDLSPAHVMRASNGEDEP
jgi:hypothetical protein